MDDVAQLALPRITRFLSTTANFWWQTSNTRRGSREGATFSVTPRAFNLLTSSPDVSVASYMICTAAPRSRAAAIRSMMCGAETL